MWIDEKGLLLFKASILAKAEKSEGGPDEANWLTVQTFDDEIGCAHSRAGEAGQTQA